MATTTTTVVRQQPGTGTLAVLTNLLEKHKDQIAMALPRHMTPERMIRIALTAVSRTPLLAQCSPLSLASSVVQSSVLGLEPNTIMGESYLVPFWNSKLVVPGKEKPGGYEAQLIPGYMGLLKLARNSGEVSVFDAQIVYSNDQFDFEKGSDIYWRHKWCREGERGYSQGAWAGYCLKDKSRNFEYWTIPQIEEHRDQYSQGAYKKDYGKLVLDANGNKILVGAWADSPDWMYKKTVIRQTVKLMPKSIELSTALKLDELGEVSLPQDIDLLPEGVTTDPDMNQPLETDEHAKTSSPKRKSESAKQAQAPADPVPTEPKTETVKPTPSAEMDPKKIKPLFATLGEIEGMRDTIGKDAWWAILGEASYTVLTEIPTQSEALLLLGVMKARVK